MLNRITRRVLTTVADRVAQNNLFEKPGERAWQPPLKPGLARVSTAAAAGALAGPLLVHHWATWCEPCEEELPLVDALARDLAGRAATVGISWDRFQDHGPMEETLKRVDAMSQSKDLSWPTLVLTDSPEATFKALGLDVHTVPQTLLLGADGSVLAHVPGPLDAATVQALKAKL